MRKYITIIQIFSGKSFNLRGRDVNGIYEI
nr:MAG TPA: hypothetical protein [Caudoviricetes sp.]